jgi:hypothetical protein
MGRCVHTDIRHTFTLLIPFEDSRSSNPYIRSPESTHAIVAPQGRGNHIDVRPPSLYGFSGSQAYSVPSFEREQPARPGPRDIPAKPPPVVLSYPPIPQSPPIVSEQPTPYLPPRTGRSPSRNTERNTGHPGGDYPSGGMSVNIFCCSKSGTQAL